MSEYLFNSRLFELESSDCWLNGRKSEATELVRRFLLSASYPWELLGGRLDAFLEQLVASVAPGERLRGVIHPGAFLEGNAIVIEPGAVVEPTAYIAGPCYVCAGAVVRHGAYIRGQVFVGEGAVVGHTSEVKGSILLQAAKAAHFAYVGNSILGCDANLGAGTKLANLRFDHKVVTLALASPKKYGTESTGAPEQMPPTTVSTGLKKLGAILGNRAQTGCNSVTNPGTILTADSWLKPGEVASGVIARRLPGQRLKNH